MIRPRAPDATISLICGKKVHLSTLYGTSRWKRHNVPLRRPVEGGLGGTRKYSRPVSSPDWPFLPPQQDWRRAAIPRRRLSSHVKRARLIVCASVPFLFSTAVPGSGRRRTLTDTTTRSTSGSLAMSSGLLYALSAGTPWKSAAALADFGFEVARAASLYWSVSGPPGLMA